MRQGSKRLEVYGNGAGAENVSETQKPLEPLLQQLGIWSVSASCGQVNLLVVQAFQAMHQHRTVLLVENILAYLDNKIRPYTYKDSVERRVVELA